MSAQDKLGRQWTVQHHGDHPYGGQWASVQNEAGQDAGHMRYTQSGWKDKKGQEHVDVAYVHVDPEHRGQGAANALYRAVHEHTGKPFLHWRDEMTPEAKRAVARSAAEDPERHRVVRWVKNERRIQKWPRR